MPGPKRSVRVAGQLKAALTTVLSREVSNPVLQDVVVTSTELTDDLGMLTVHVRRLVGTDQDEVLKALRRASGLIKRELVRRVRLRTVPELRFFFDEGQDRQARVEELLREIERERKS
jgi:ribosome-binding factor A